MIAYYPVVRCYSLVQACLRLLPLNNDNPLTGYTERHGGAGCLRSRLFNPSPRRPDTVSWVGTPRPLRFDGARFLLYTTVKHTRLQRK